MAMSSNHQLRENFPKRVVEIYSLDQSIAETLSTTVRLVSQCHPRVSASFPWSTPVADSGEAGAFASIIYLSENDAASAIAPFLQWAAEIRKKSLFHKLFVVLGNLDDNHSIQIQQHLLTTCAVQIFERPLNLQRLRYQVESTRIEYEFWLRNLPFSTTPHPDWSVKLQDKIAKAARVDTNVLLTGETGVGKTYWAERIHKQSSRAKEPYVVVNCGSIPASLVDSHLFGHEAGSFTGADRKATGQFAFAGQGTVFLDEIDSLPFESQAHLLRVVENREFCSVGSVKPIQMRARVIAAANRNLETLVDAGTFRQDLFYRLDGYEITIPPLRERREEIPELCSLFANNFVRDQKLPAVTIDPNAMELLVNGLWPGNLRQLKNVVEAAIIDCDDSVIRKKDLPARFVETQNSRPQSVEATCDESSQSDSDKVPSSEASRLVRALAKYNNNRSKVAQELGVSRMTVYNLLRRYHLI